MPTFYTLDRRGLLQEGNSFELVPLEGPPLLNDELFTKGVSQHGLTYSLHNAFNMPDNPYGQSIELALELIRKDKFPEKPSRLQSMFACEDLDDVKHFRGSSLSRRSTPIFEVTTENYHRGDMNIFSVQCNMNEFYQRLYKYWSGETINADGYEPFWEIVIPLPTTIGPKVA
ncbi:DUF2441 domain-containing protein [Citrobacter braakii]|nr:DUF2441 domain-containing protein [Citrobacter freundii]EGT5654218.1 DUF2441 domain-containing protein [Citrobacter braakii]MBC6555341.1 DUF2441 domain-containing protein [Citrobacter braakii]QLW73619.1 DUF2441 domain-containing protein [Citrobacter freundii]